MLLVFALALLGAWAVVGAAEGVLGLLALLADVGLVEDKDPGAAVARFVVQEQVGDGSQDGPVLGPVAAGQEARQLGAVACLGANRPGGLGGGQAAAVADEGSHQADEQGGGGLGQACRTEEGLDLGERVGEDHGGTPSATEDRLGYPSLYRATGPLRRSPLLAS